MHQVHTERELRYLCDDAWCLLLTDAGEEEECSEGCHKEVWHAELPTPLKHWSVDWLHRNTSEPERPCREGCSCHEACSTNHKAFLHIPVEVYSDVMCQYEVSEISRTIVQSVEVWIPETLSEHLWEYKSLQPRHCC